MLFECGLCHATSTFPDSRSEEHGYCLECSAVRLYEDGEWLALTAKLPPTLPAKPDPGPSGAVIFVSHRSKDLSDVARVYGFAWWLPLLVSSSLFCHDGNPLCLIKYLLAN